MLCLCCGHQLHKEGCPYAFLSSSFERWVAFEQLRQGQRDKEGGYPSLAETHPEETDASYILGYEKGPPLLENDTPNPHPASIGVIKPHIDSTQNDSLATRIWKALQ